MGSESAAAKQARVTRAAARQARGPSAAARQVRGTEKWRKMKIFHSPFKQISLYFYLLGAPKAPKKCLGA